MTFTLSSVRAMKPHELATAAHHIAIANDEFDQAMDSVLQQSEWAHGSWTGVGGDAALERARAEVRAGRTLVERVAEVVRTLNQGAARLGPSKDSLLGAVDAALAERFIVHELNWTVTDPSGQEREQARANHHAAIQSRLKSLISEDGDVGYAIDSAIDETTATADDVAHGRTYAPPPSLVGLPPQQLTAVLNDPRFTEWVSRHPDAAKRLLDAAADAGVIPSNKEFYRNFLRNFWRREALEQASIDPATWDPAKGTRYNAKNITKVYEYYGQLFLDHPEFQWAGMANMIGASFAGGFYDLNMLKKLGDLPLRLRRANPLLNGLAGLTDDEIAWYETKLLSMQKQIFDDQGSMHEAYLRGGTAEIERMTREGLIDDNGLRAWRDIDQGVAQHNPDLIAQGNKALLYREQHDIIDDDYRQMFSHGVTGPAVTYGLTTVGAPSIPGAHTFAQEFPLDVTVRTGLITQAHMTTSLPDGNIADFGDRWKLIEDDTLPAYQKLLSTDADAARAIVSSDFGTRLDEQRLARQWDDILSRLGKMGFGVDLRTPW